MSIERRLAALEQRQPPELPQELPPCHTREEIASWWAQRYNWARAAQTLEVTETQAVERFGEQTGWHELQARIKELTTQARSLCTTKEQEPRPPEEQPPPELRNAPPEMRMDRRRWRQIERSKRRPGTR